MIFGFHTELPLSVVGPRDRTPTRTPDRIHDETLTTGVDAPPPPTDAPLPRIGVWISCEFTLTV